MNGLVLLLWSVGLVCAAGKPQRGPPIRVSVPATQPVTVRPAAGLVVGLAFDEALQVDVAGLSASEVREAVLDIGPTMTPGMLRTRRLDGARWKCTGAGDGDERWLTESHDELAITRVRLSEGGAVEGGVRLSVPLLRFVSPVTSELTAQLTFPGRSFEFRLALDKPYALSAVRAEMLRQYQRVGPTLLVVGRTGLTFVRVQTDVCGDSRLTEDLFDAKSIVTLARPTPEWRLATAHGWVFAEKVDPTSTGVIGPVDLAHVELRNLTFLGDHYERRLDRVTTIPGRATAVFSVGDFSGCFGAGCGDPVNVREAHVTLEGGTLSTKFLRPP